MEKVGLGENFSSRNDRGNSQRTSGNAIGFHPHVSRSINGDSDADQALSLTGMRTLLSLLVIISVSNEIARARE